MATDPYAAIRNLSFTPTYTLRANLGGGNRINETFNSRAEAEARQAELGANGATINEVYNPDMGALTSGGFNTKYGSSAMLQDGKLLVNLQQPGAHKYDTMDAIYEKDPASGQWVLKNDPMQMQTRQQSSASNLGQALGTAAALFGGAYLMAPAAAAGASGGGFGLGSALGGGVAGNAAAGALVGTGGSALSGGNTEENLRAGLVGGITGGIGGYMSEPGMAVGNTGSSSAAQSGIGATTQANQLTPAALESLIGTPGYGVNAAANSYLQSIGMAPTAGWNAYGLGNTQGAQLADTESLLNSGDWSSPFTTPQVPTEVPSDFSPTQQVEVVGQAPVAPTTPTVIPPTIPSAAETAQPTPSKGTAPAEEPEQPSLGGKFTDFLKNNPRLALTMLGMLGGGGGGNSSGGGGAGAGGAQGNLTATQAPKFQRQYVAPPEGYRPGFDPEHRYFTGIGNAGTGG